MTVAESVTNPFPTHTLHNGLRIVAQPMHGVESLAVGLCVATGSRDEQPNHAGITHFIDGLAFQGTARRSVRELTEAFEDLGASGIVVGNHSCCLPSSSTTSFDAWQ